jgi:2-polyprenyl-6-methoxyphenol hydroxylase-like FAD-dependent oxidoreductase
MTCTQVLIAGGGPVGMTLALVLAHFGVRSVLVERNATTTRHPKMDITNTRSMELFRRIGLADQLRAVAVAESQPFDVSWITTLTGDELHRFAYPSVTAFRARMRRCNDGTMPSEPPMRVSQVLIEPVLKAAIDRHPAIDVRFGVALDGFVRDEHGVTAHLSTGDAIRADFLAGCDGGASRVRDALDICLSGQANVAQRFITHFRSHETRLLQRWGPAWHYQSDQGTLVAQNDIDTWTLLSRFPDGLTFDEVDPSTLIEAFVGAPIDHEIIVCNAWWPNLLVADSFGEGRVWLAGDAVHQFIPTGAYGMNTGIGDAFDLGWKLAAVLGGFGGAKLMASYEQERRPVALANCAGSARHNAVRARNGALYGAGIDVAEMGRRIAENGNVENESFGLEMGYSYHASPVVLPCTTEAPNTDPIAYRPSTLPGSRLPSVYLPDGDNLHDRLGPWFSLLCFEECDTSGFVEAAEACDLPLHVVQVDITAHAALFQGPVLLVRPDQHIAWRGGSPDRNEAARILDHVCGRGRDPAIIASTDFVAALA